MNSFFPSPVHVRFPSTRMVGSTNRRTIVVRPPATNSRGTNFLLLCQREMEGQLLDMHICEMRDGGVQFFNGFVEFSRPHARKRHRKAWLLIFRIKLPVTLNDDNTNMRSTIRSPDAEKLVPFTPAEIMQKQEEGQSVVDDISIAMDNTEAVCFVKYYDKKMDSAVARRYVILKTYTLTELEEIGQDKALVTPETIRLDSQAHSALPSEATLVPPTSNKEASSQAEFFTPTTKKILEEVAQQGTQASTSSTASPAAKRSISFGTITAQDLQAAALEQPALQSPATAETPAKKNKGEKN